MITALKFFISLLFICCATVSAAPAITPPDYTAYLSGITLLNFSGLTPYDQHTQYKKLELLTGVTAAMAETYISSYKNKPVQWQKLQDQIITLLQGATDTCPQPSKNSPTRISKQK